MKKTILALVATSALCRPVYADETVMFQTWLQDINCAIANNDQSANQVVYLENFFDALQTQLPAALPIVETIFWFDGPAPIPSNMQGNIAFAIDPGRSYTGGAGYPLTQLAWPQTLKSLTVWEAPGRRKERVQYSPPVSYRIGHDSLIMAAECASTPNANNVFVAAPSLTIGYASIGDIPKPPPENYLVNIPASSLKMTTGAASYTIRSTVPASTVPVTSIRAHVLWPEYNGPAPAPPVQTTISHLSIGTRSGSTSSTTAPPVPLTFHKKPSWRFWWRQQMWSDCVDFSSPAGQQLLVSVSLDQSINSFTYFDGLGLPSYVSSDPSQWDKSSLTGTVTTIANRFYVVDRVQINCK